MVEVGSHVLHVQKEERSREFLLPRKNIFLSMIKKDGGTVRVCDNTVEANNVTVEDEAECWQSTVEWMLKEFES